MSGQAVLGALENARRVWAVHARLCGSCAARQQAAEAASAPVPGMCDLGRRLFTALEALRKASQRS